MNKFITVFFCFLFSSGLVGYVYVSDRLEAAFAANQPNGLDIEVRGVQEARVDQLVAQTLQGEVEELFPES